MVKVRGRVRVRVGNPNNVGQLWPWTGGSQVRVGGRVTVGVSVGVRVRVRVRVRVGNPNDVWLPWPWTGGAQVRVGGRVVRVAG